MPPAHGDRTHPSPLPRNARNSVLAEPSTRGSLGARGTWSPKGEAELFLRRLRRSGARTAVNSSSGGTDRRCQRRSEYLGALRESRNPAGRGKDPGNWQGHKLQPLPVRPKLMSIWQSVIYLLVSVMSLLTDNTHLPADSIHPLVWVTNLCTKETPDFLIPYS
ncbi:hypothetical protein TREES_T100007647 [Tupaia chinensis]|uniref:Uncharacterized protein n=1 Tax=Tupaia chinensis TaxID=246437 RepID=L9KSI2_TUPCH|nr:hypothetical protein TREES_T100007647 [Tupaia chinensis]